MPATDDDIDDACDDIDNNGSIDWPFTDTLLKLCILSQIFIAE